MPIVERKINKKGIIMAKGYAQGSADGPKYIFGKENVNWGGPRQASEGNIDGSVVGIRSEFSHGSEHMDIDDKYAAIEDILESSSNINALDWLTNHSGLNDETLDFAAEELGVEFNGYEDNDEKYELLSEYAQDLPSTQALEWVTNYAGYNDEVINWAAQELGLDFDDEEYDEDDDFDLDDDLDDDYDDYRAEDDYDEFDDYDDLNGLNELDGFGRDRTQDYW